MVEQRRRKTEEEKKKRRGGGEESNNAIRRADAEVEINRPHTWGLEPVKASLAASQLPSLMT